MLLFILALFSLCFSQNSRPIHLNQIGYYPTNKKLATVPDTNVQQFSIIDALSNQEVFNGSFFRAGYYAQSKENVSIADFSSYTTPGTYKLVIGSSDSSYHFSIKDNVYSSALQMITKSYYYQRCSYTLDTAYAGKWSRASGHPDSSIALLDIPNMGAAKRDVRGGWYDAGDFGKYVVCAGITCATMLGSFELCPEILDDSSLFIPESGNKKSDLLDEIKYELDWLARMQDDDGGVFFKVGPTIWPGDIMPSSDKTVRYLIGKSTTSSLNFAAVMAMAGRIYRNYDSSFARQCSDRAENAWKWSMQNQRIVYPENTDGTGPYEDGSDVTYADEFFWALTELSITTGKEEYKDSLITGFGSKKIRGPAWWQDVRNLAFFSLVANRNVLPDSLGTKITASIINNADVIVADINSSAYRIPMKSENYLWGSNGTAGNIAVILAYAHYLTRQQQYLDALTMTTDYLFGRNPTGYCYVTGLGSKPPVNPHHRQSTADNILEPVPGFVVGGPNKSTSGADDELIELIEAGTPPAACYIDVKGSWASNENSINQNAPWVLVLSYLEKYASESRISPVTKHSYQKGRNDFDLQYSPLSKCILIKGKISPKDATLCIYDLHGKCILKKTLNMGERKIDLHKEEICSGAVIVKLLNGIEVVNRIIHLVK
jgi:endoglucanase